MITKLPVNKNVIASATVNASSLQRITLEIHFINGFERAKTWGPDKGQGKGLGDFGGTGELNLPSATGDGWYEIRLTFEHDHEKGAGFQRSREFDPEEKASQPILGDDGHLFILNELVCRAEDADDNDQNDSVVVFTWRTRGPFEEAVTKPFRAGKPTVDYKR